MARISDIRPPERRCITDVTLSMFGPVWNDLADQVRKNFQTFRECRKESSIKCGSYKAVNCSLSPHIILISLNTALLFQVSLQAADWSVFIFCEWILRYARTSTNKCNIVLSMKILESYGEVIQIKLWLFQHIQDPLEKENSVTNGFWSNQIYLYWPR